MIEQEWSAGPQMSQLVPSAGFYDTYVDEHNPYTMYSMYPSSNPMNASDVWDLADEKGLLVSSLEGLHSGVPTRTTPTLTPTALRAIEQTFLDIENESVKHSREAGFVPPLIEPSQPTPAQTTHSSNGLAPNLAQHHQIAQPPAQQQQQQHQLHLHLEHQPQAQPHQQQHQHQHKHQHQPQLSPPQTLTPPLHVQPQVQLHIQHQQLQQQQQQQQQGKTAKRNMGGRRPTRTIGMTPEEEERKQIRRERNKEAAARCRKRRMDHTNSLLEETEGLEQKKQSLQDEISQLQQEKEDLEFMLEAHRPVCRLQSSSPPDVKPVITDGGKISLSSVDGQQQHLQQPEEFAELPCADSSAHNLSHNHNRNNNNNNSSSSNNNNHHGGKQVGEGESGAAVRLSRPNSLPIPTFTEPKSRPSSLQFKTVETPAFMKNGPNEIAGIPITTPSSGIPFNFDSLMEGGTGLTPVSTPLVPSCSSQQRSNGLQQHLHQQHHQQQQQQHATHHVGAGAVDLSSPDANPKLVSL